MAKFKEKPVIRDDGKRYKSVNDAARDLVAEGLTSRSYRSLSPSISAVAKHKTKTVYGHSFRYEVEEIDDSEEACFTRWFGSRLELVRSNRNMTRKQLGLLAGIDTKQISYFEEGGMPDALEVKKLSEALGLSCDVLLGVVFKW